LLSIGCDAPPPRPNLVLVVVDALRADHVGSYGYERATTPNLDQLASEGLRFERSLSAASWTLPSLMSLFTSRYPPSLPNDFDAVPRAYALHEDEETLAEQLRKAGYRTLSVTTNPFNVEPIFRLMQGFEERRHELSAPASWVVDQALELIAEHQPRTPFFLYLHLMDTHTPYAPPPPFDSMFVDEGSEVDARAGKPAGVSSPSELGSDEFERRRQATLALYDGALRFADAQLGRLLAGLDALDLRRRTVIAVTSDHGESFWDRVPLEFEFGLHAHGSPRRYGVGHGQSVFAELVHVPLILQGPGVPSGVSGRAASGLDLAPTLLALARVPPAERGARGANLLSETAGAPAFSETTHAAGRTQRSVVGRRHQLVRLGDTEWVFDTQRPGWPEAEAPDEIRRALARELDTHAESADRVRFRDDALDTGTIEELRALGYTE